jgi:predicted O-methyltransferase YrrM
MIVNERVIAYLHSLEQGNGEFCDKIEEYAHKTDVPIIRKEMESFLRVMIQLRAPKQILELGTAIGYSAILMAKTMPADCKITTIENYEKRIPIAKENIMQSGYGDRIQLIEGDALEVIQGLDGPFDFIFMDAAKAQYMSYLEALLPKMPKGAVLIADNVLQEGELIESKYVIERRNRTIHARMREFLYTLKHMPEFETTIIPIGDGVAMAIRK